ncbi:MAG: HAD family hydrolase [Spirochaetaceae bacterium]
MNLYRLPTVLRAVAFDVDNTLYENRDYADYQQRVLIERLADGMAVPADQADRQVEEYRNRRAAETGRRPSLADTSRAFGFDIATSVRWRLEYVAPEEFLGPDPRLREVMESLAQVHVVAAVTNNPVEIGRRTLRCLGVEECFRTVIGLDSTQASKPDPLPFQLLADTLQIPLSETLVVGDRYAVDLEPALELGGGAVLVEGIRDTYALCELLARCSAERARPGTEAVSRYR